MKIGLIIGAIVILLCAVVAATALSGSSRKTASFAEARELREPCEVYGEIVKESVSSDFKELRFVLKEVKRGSKEGEKLYTGATIPVVYTKTKPDSFDQASDVKAIGAFTGTEFRADGLLVKCPSKYDGTGAKTAAQRKALATANDKVTR